MNTQPLVTLVPWTMIAQFLNLMIQLFLIKKFLFKPVNDILEKRRQLTDQAIREAREAKEEADGLKTQYESGIAKAREEAAAGIKAQAEADIAQERKKAINEVKNEIGGLAMDIAGKVVEKEIDEADHKRLIDDFIKNVGEAS